MKKEICFFLLILLAFSYFQLSGQENKGEPAKPPVLEIKSLKAEPGVILGGARGVRVIMEASFSSNNKRQTPVIGIDIFDKADRPVRTAIKNSIYDLGGRAGTRRAVIVFDWPITFFVPYYALDFGEGKQVIEVRVFAGTRDSARAPVKRVDCTGMDRLSLEIDKPPVQVFRVLVRELRVEEKNLHDNNWDSGGSRSRLPDLRYKVILGAKPNSDTIFISTVVKNTLSAGWVDFSGEITISEGDVVTILACDKDTMFDDPIGRLKLDLEQLKKISRDREKIHFGLVHTCLLEIKTTR